VIYWPLADSFAVGQKQKVIDFLGDTLNNISHSYRMTHACLFNASPRPQDAGTSILLLMQFF
jgi:hypothetical protein